LFGKFFVISSLGSLTAEIEFCIQHGWQRQCRKQSTVFKKLIGLEMRVTIGTRHVEFNGSGEWVIYKGGLNVVYSF